MAKPKVLVVEDNLIEQKLLTLLLDRFGCSAFVVSDGVQALTALQSPENDFDLILMDWQMCDMDGLECTRKIRALEEGSDRHIPIIAVTARVLLGDKQKCLQAGMNDYLSKPYTTKQFEAILSTWLRQDSYLTG